MVADRDFERYVYHFIFLRPNMLNLEQRCQLACFQAKKTL
ncbi:hypothetical protein DSUL_90018 [Desulfovibrionales bacterium]